MSPESRELLRSILSQLDNETVMESEDYVELLGALKDALSQRLENYFEEVNK